MTEQTRQLRTSLYLVNRADALLGALKFFLNTAGDSRERRLQFLVQSDFWEWEIDNLIYSFTNFAERKQTWESGHAAKQKLTKLGLVLDAKLVKRVRWRDRWQLQTHTSRVAPAAMLRDVIDVWNELVRVTESEFVTPFRDNAKKWNIDTRLDLKSLRKEMPNISTNDDIA